MAVEITDSTFSIQSSLQCKVRKLYPITDYLLRYLFPFCLGSLQKRNCSKEVCKVKGKMEYLAIKDLKRTLDTQGKIVWNLTVFLKFKKLLKYVTVFKPHPVFFGQKKTPSAVWEIWGLRGNDWPLLPYQKKRFKVVVKAQHVPFKCKWSIFYS